MQNNDSEDLRVARSLYNARFSESSLVAWTLSPCWTMVDPTNYKVRGLRTIAHSTRPLFVEACSGEIKVAK